tara:strand:- start:3232 stop:3480 length:249 start_codon:yes stop_codon:yes gene_type:complete
MKIYELVYFEDGQKYSCFTTDLAKLEEMSKMWTDNDMETKYDSIREVTFDSLEDILKYMNEHMAKYDSGTQTNAWFKANKLI